MIAAAADDSVGKKVSYHGTSTCILVFSSVEVVCSVIAVSGHDGGVVIRASFQLVADGLRRLSLALRFFKMEFSLTRENVEVYEDLRSLGCCQRCCLRYLGERNPQSYNRVKETVVKVCCI